MRWGTILLFCPICGASFAYDGNALNKDYWHSREFGIVDSRKCWEESEKKYARMVMGKDDKECHG